MRTHDDGSTRPPSVPPSSPTAPPANVFTRDFLTRFDEPFDEDTEPATAFEAEVAGVGPVFPVEEGFAVYLPGASEERGNLPVAVFRERWRAQLAAAVLPGTGRDPLVRLKKDGGPQGYPLVAGLDLDGNPDLAGHLRHFDEALASALHIAEALLRSPDCVAALLAAAGKVTLERVGTLLDGRVPASQS
jgi:hypothetical protein